MQVIPITAYDYGRVARGLACDACGWNRTLVRHHARLLLRGGSMARAWNARHRLSERRLAASPSVSRASAAHSGMALVSRAAVRTVDARLPALGPLGDHSATVVAEPGADYGPPWDLSTTHPSGRLESRLAATA